MNSFRSDLTGLVQDQIELERQKLAELSTFLRTQNEEGSRDIVLSSSSADETAALLVDRVSMNHGASYGSHSDTSPVKTKNGDDQICHNKLGAVTESFGQDSNCEDDQRPKQELRGFNFDADTVWQSIRNVFDRCFQPPVVGSILGIIAAMTPIRGLFVDIVDRRSDAPLQWMFDGLYSVGQTAVPINMMILGCNLSSDKKSGNQSSSHGLFSGRTAVGIVLGKMVILPIIGILSVFILKHYIWDIPDEIDGSFYIVMIIVFLCPTANNVMVMVELSGSDAKEGIARVIAMQYAVAPLILSLTITIAIGVADSWS